MAAVAYDITYTEPRNRLTTAFRLILAIPHLIVSAVWSYFAEILAFIQWFIILFTGKRNGALWDLQYAFFGYYGRVNGYIGLLFDEYPAFGTDPGRVPVRTELAYEEPANRLTNGLRLIWIIPALIIGLVLGIAAFFVVIVSWFTILFTGKHPRGQFDFLLKYNRFNMALQSYALLMNDAYPSWGAASTVPSLPPGAPASPYGTTATTGPPVAQGAPPPPPPTSSATPPPPPPPTV